MFEVASSTKAIALVIAVGAGSVATNGAALDKSKWDDEFRSGASPVGRNRLKE